MKKIFSILLSISVVLLSVSLSSDVMALEERTVLYLDYGDVTINENDISGYDKNGKLVTEPNPCGYIVTQLNSARPLDRGISVTADEQDVELKDVNISRTGENDSAFCVLKTAKASLTLAGENHLVSGTYRAGVEIAVNAELTIGGDGVLYAQSNIEAGIGGGNGHSNGTLIINSGTIYATGGIDGYGTGIGGGSSGSGGTITINGGNVVAVGGEYGAGIGGGMLGKGGTITINGGTVTATGGAKAAGIGGGFTANGGTVVINGGSVKAVGGADAENIGNGYNCRTAFGGVHNSEGNTVSMVEIPLTDFNSVYLKSIEGTPVTSGHPNDDKLYFYTDGNKSIATAYMNDMNVKFFICSDSGVEEAKPYTGGDERFSDCLITSDKDKISAAEGFSIEKESCRLMYNGSCVDKFEIVIRGDINRDGRLDGMDAVEASCVQNGMKSDILCVKLADANFNGKVDDLDVEKLNEMGIAAKA